MASRTIRDTLWTNHEVEFATWHLQQFLDCGPEAIEDEFKLFEIDKQDIPFRRLPLAYAVGFLGWNGLTPQTAACICLDTFRNFICTDKNGSCCLICTKWPDALMNRPYGDPKWIEQVMIRAIELGFIQPHSVPDVKGSAVEFPLLSKSHKIALTLDCVKLLSISMPSDLDEAQSPPEKTFLEQAITLACRRGSSRCVAFLLESSAAKRASADDWLAEASAYGHLEVVKLLLSHEVRPTDESLKLALCYRHVSVVEVLLDNGANALATVPLVVFENTRPISMTLLHAAVANRDENIARLLLSRGADVNFTADDEQAWTPLHLVCLQNQPSMIKFLVSEGKADIEARDSDGLTPLALATLCGRIKAVEQLLDLDADPLAMDKKGRETIYFAFGSDTSLPASRSIAQALLKARAKLLLCGDPPKRKSADFLLQAAARKCSKERCEALRQAIIDVKEKLPFPTPAPEEWP
ncbi:Ankyrin repeat and FYVE domain-containing protein 1 [Phlyctochytrium bullatum]|nr:Ankyrin repeat and FYVE domain-containing protein 1 [Phlyctochytrium bullatum]